jgi:hypothetical protein
MDRVTGSAVDPFEAFAPNEHALLDWVSPLMDDAALDEIAAADYGYHAREHRGALTDLLYLSKLPDWLDWYPGEVLALTRWGTPVDRRDHLKRLFACLFMVRAATPDGEPVGSLALLMDSTWELGPPARAAAVRYLAWCRRHLPCDWQHDHSSTMFLTLALLLLSRSSTMARLLIDELDAVLNDPELPWRRRPSRSPLFIRRPSDGSTTRQLWPSLVTRCLIDDAAGADPRMAVLGRVLTGENATPIGELRPLFPADT